MTGTAIPSHTTLCESRIDLLGWVVRDSWHVFIRLSVWTRFREYWREGFLRKLAIVTVARISSPRSKAQETGKAAAAWRAQNAHRSHNTLGVGTSRNVLVENGVL